MVRRKAHITAEDVAEFESGSVHDELIQRISDYTVSPGGKNGFSLDRHPRWQSSEHQEGISSFIIGDVAELTETIPTHVEVKTEFSVPAVHRLTEEREEQEDTPGRLKKTRASAAAIATGGLAMVVRLKNRSGEEVRMVADSLNNLRDWLGVRLLNTYSTIMAPEQRGGRRQVFGATILGAMAISALNRSGAVDMGVEVSEHFGDYASDISQEDEVVDYPHTPPPPLESSRSDSQIDSGHPLSRIVDPVTPATDLPVSEAEKPAEIPDRGISGYSGSDGTNNDLVSGEPISKKSQPYVYDGLTYSGDTIWDNVKSHLSDKYGYEPSDQQINKATQRVLDYNELNWDMAQELPRKYKFKIPKDL